MSVPVAEALWLHLRVTFVNNVQNSAFIVLHWMLHHTKHRSPAPSPHIFHTAWLSNWMKNLWFCWSSFSRPRRRVWTKTRLQIKMVSHPESWGCAQISCESAVPLQPSLKTSTLICWDVYLHTFSHFQTHFQTKFTKWCWSRVWKCNNWVCSIENFYLKKICIRDPFCSIAQHGVEGSRDRCFQKNFKLITELLNYLKFKGSAWCCIRVLVE